MSLEDAEAKLREGIIHLRFAMMMCKMQSEKGRLLMFVHPSSARSWMTQVVKDIIQPPGVMIVEFVFCQFGMKSKDIYGEGLVKKIIKIMTNSTKLAQRFFRAQCTNNRRHVPLVNF